MRRTGFIFVICSTIFLIFFLLFVLSNQVNACSEWQDSACSTHPQQATQLSIIAPERIYYVSCLLNGVGPGIDLTPFKIVDFRTGETSTIPVGTWVIHTVDETGSFIPPDSRGRVLITWQNRDYWITATAIARPGADGKTDCEGHIPPAPTITQPAPTRTANLVRVTILPYQSPTPTLIPLSTSEASLPDVVVITATPRATFDPAIPSYEAGHYDLPDVRSPFGSYSPAVVGSFRFYDGKTLDLVPVELEECVDTSPVDKQDCYSEFHAENTQSGTGIPVYSPAAGCAYLLPDNITIVLIINCEQNIAFTLADGTTVRGRREIMLTHLDPQTTKHINAGGTKVDSGKYLGSLCLISDKGSCNIITDMPPYLSMKLRINTGLDYFAATNDEMLAFVAQPRCLYDHYLYSPINPSLNPKPLQACPKG